MAKRLSSKQKILVRSPVCAPGHHPHYYPKAVLKAAIGELVTALEIVWDDVDMTKQPMIDEMVREMIVKHKTKSGILDE